MPRLTIDKDRCDGCGLCAYTAPVIFMIEDGVSTVRVAPITLEEFNSQYLKDAIDDCPVEALKIEE